MSALKGKVALVTGAGAGIGEAIALAFAEHGATVAAADIDEQAARRTASKAEERGARATAIHVDCGDVASIDEMVGRTVDELGCIDVIVNNAGVTRAADIMDLTEEDWDRIVGVNAKGVFFCLQAAARQMIRQGGEGRIINIASISGRGYARASSAIYAASKGAVISMTKTAAQQLARHDINVNSICPGPTLTDLVSQIMKTRASDRGATAEDVMSESLKLIPLGRFGTPDDVAAMAVFLASPGARNITGQSYNVDGGLVMS